jgi:hypothetical protein
MANARTLFAIVGCFVAAIGLTWRIFAHPIPKKNDLMPIEGIVREVTTGVRKSKYDTARYPMIHIVGRIGAYSYLDWFPDPDRIYQNVQPGDRIRILSDTPEGNRWVWQLEKDGKLIVNYDDVLSAVRSNRGIDPYLALFLALAGLFGVFRFVRMREKKANQSVQPMPGSVTPRAPK